jgi:acetyl esterase/lipase
MLFSHAPLSHSALTLHSPLRLASRWLSGGNWILATGYQQLPSIQPNQNFRNFIHQYRLRQEHKTSASAPQRKMKNSVLFLVSLLFVCARQTLPAQCLLIDAQYSVLPTQRVVYETEQKMNLNDGTKFGLPVPVEMDIYRPAAAGGSLKPLVVLAHGVEERKDAPRWVAMATSLAQRGYVVVSIDYREDSLLVEEIVAAALVCGTAPCKLAAFTRMLYLNGIDIHRAINYMLARQATYGIDPNRILLGGHSMGAGSIIMAATVTKFEVASLFPASFWTDPYYVNFDLNHPRIKGVMAFGPAVLDLNFIDASDNMPMFLFSGTHDCVTPFYSGRQLCLDATNPVVYGGAALAQRIDQFWAPASYYFIEARGVGHTIGLCEPAVFPNPADDLQQLYFPDMLRFMKTTMLDGYQNQIHKVVTPLNTSLYDYCDSTGSAKYNILAGYFLTSMALSGGACFDFPFFLLSTQPWAGPAYSACTFPALYPASDGLCGLYLKQGADADDPYTTGNWPLADHRIQENFSLKETQAWTLAPNPAHEQVAVQWKAPLAGNCTLELLNAQGTAVRTKLTAKGATTTTLGLEDLPAGIYFLRVQEEGGIIATQKLMKE